MERLNHIVISAAKQSRQLFYPKIHELKKMEDIMAINEAQQKLIAHCVGQKESLLNLYKKNEDALLLIGPEGDFTNKEIEQAINKNYQPVSLGNSILRVETAGIAATVIVTAINAN
jgi:16S rRNA (uracil1498-N3)-methyltransferase